ncbi:Threonine--tRNA ligase, cytoplasmic [Porphyridium purpureum]|uniref:Probable threonine--tRNA ligase, cytoplasmic n=1 Tax=Porphyridium purpureum TaxID=35688 RepID=A0A5J4YTR3_PORPP|nr:Threonine--tRNA ligase, cytoplasmic [Porphyridium purpureum]|eukprot:POR1407..scf229_5
MADESWGGGNVDDAPSYVAHRIAVWDAAVARRGGSAGIMPAAGMDGAPIRVTLPDGTVQEGTACKTSPMDIAMRISEGLARKALVAMVDGKQWDMERPLETDCTLKICDFETDEGKSVLWHSTAHMLGEALEYKFKGELCIGPPLEDGFYYDMFMQEKKVVEADFSDLEKRVERIAKSKRTFQRMELSKEEALEMFGYNRFKTELINKLEEGTTITAYRDGPFIDLCRGPHVPASHRVKAMACTKASQAYWLGKAENPSLQRVYGISFPDSKLLKEYKKLMEEAAKRDHRVISRDQELVMFHPYSPGSAFFLPHGMRIYNTLMSFLKDEYWGRGFQEVNSPNIYDFALWETSGHAANYRENMFGFEVEKRDFGLKPMNCPGHCLIFGMRPRSYRELPMRLADFGVLHRNELSGALSGLTRVRRFQQDDAHIFCTQEQVAEEVVGCLEFLKFVYGKFGFTFELHLSTRPEKYLGELEMWDRAEAQLAQALEQFTGKKCNEKDGWKLNPEDGAFYGPKIDIKVFDALKRRHQCATVQLDFQLPLRFNLQYTGSENNDPIHPVIIHRAIYGSFERFFAILCEHYGGKWPLWLSPRQVVVVPVSEKFSDYAKSVQTQVLGARFFADVDVSDRKLQKKIREAQLAQYNFILVVGEEEQSKGTVNVRNRNNDVEGEAPIEEFIARLHQLRDDFQ